MAKNFIDGFLAPLIVILVGSVFYLTAAATDCDQADDCSDSYYVWALVCSCLAIVIALVMMVLAYLNVGPPLMHTLVALFLVIWLGLGCLIATFKSPFTVTTNGYFASWTAFLGAIYYLWCASEVAKSGVLKVNDEIKKLGFPGLIFMFFLSIVCLTASGIACEEGDCTSEEAWAVAFSCITLVLSAIIVILLAFTGFMKPIIHIFVAVFFIAFSAAGAGVLTFRGPFKVTSNGYFSAWGIFLCSCWYLYDAYQLYKGNDQPTMEHTDDPTPGEA
eukprot:CAMPEP_0177667368 /NCGR_PEP_ID=MMETSP0447-20121125/22086_1 /TAXON_ID=0 /ORGANISM="Stygamoeba regulata, Strain BSH-02190019" /LENGTH=274 /DNA_ID=CAMNT_0019173595 /DNA_START=103 /DNA_END=927 /DNA_ORIENTATION=-